MEEQYDSISERIKEKEKLIDNLERDIKKLEDNEKMKNKQIDEQEDEIKDLNE
jgi:septal ring factor EnvC (AmiA/AmiB activator)